MSSVEGMQGAVLACDIPGLVALSLDAFDIAAAYSDEVGKLRGNVCRILEKAYGMLHKGGGCVSSEAFRRWWRGGRERIRDMACVERLRDV